MKNDIRNSVRAEKKRIGRQQLQILSAPALAKVSSNAEYQKARRVMLYYPLWDEVDVRPVISEALSAGKVVILPAVRGNEIVPVRVSGDAKWQVGDFGILEPVAEPYDGPVDLVLVPGVAFDASFNRLGRGKGFYDRFLAKYPDAYRLGICFEFQKVSAVPVESFDLPMDDVIFI